MPMRFRLKLQRVDCQPIPRLALASLRGRRPVGRCRMVAGLAVSVVVLLVWATVEAGPRQGEVTLRLRRETTPTTGDAKPQRDPGSPAPSTTTTTLLARARAERPATEQLTCRDSTDARCGSFSWDPVPAENQPLTVSLEVTPSVPRAGEEVVVHVTAEDPDAQVTTNGGTYFFDDPHDRGVQVGFAYVIEPTPNRFGRWTPPTPQPSRLEMSFAHTFSLPGEFRFIFEARSGDQADPGKPDRNPYADIGRATVSITVAPSENATGPAL